MGSYAPAEPPSVSPGIATLSDLGFLIQLSSLAALFPRRFELAITLRMDLGLLPVEHVLWRHVADGAVQPHGIVFGDVLADDALRVLQG